MDPDVALTTIRDTRLPEGERLEAAIALHSWMLNGGFVPAGLTAQGRLALGKIVPSTRALLAQI